jgi:hypothetical protein
MDNMFYWCVQLLTGMAKIVGCTYEEINVVIFCILLPLVLVSMGAFILVLMLELKTSKMIITILRNKGDK